MHSLFISASCASFLQPLDSKPINPLKAIADNFDPEKIKKIYVERASKINTSIFCNGSTNLLSCREN